MCCRAVAWTASAAVEAPNPHTAHPTLAHATHKALTSHSLPLLSHASLFPTRTHLRATHDPLPSAPSSQTHSLTSHLRASYEPRPALHTLSVCALCSLAAPSHQRHQISRSCDVERCFKNVPKDSRRIKSLTNYYSASSPNAWMHQFCF